jgi:hypothetical protein
MSDEMTLPKIFLFINGGGGTRFVQTAALSQDGHFITGHNSSNEDWAKHDIGATSDWKHEEYKKHYPNGYVTEWVDGDPMLHDGIKAAYAEHQRLEAAGLLNKDEE